MKVFVNEVEIEIFNGARVIDAVNKFINLFELYEKMKKPIVVRDKWHNIIGLDGSLRDGSKIYLD